jgi:lipopolysaccharide heptosyltransferase II
MLRASPPWVDARRVLCVRLDGMGDILMTTAAMQALRAAGAAARELTLLTSAAGARVAALLPDVSSTIAYDAPWMKVDAVDPDADAAIVARLRAARFDAAVIFTVSTQSALPAALMCYLAGIPLRLARCRENPYHLLTDWVREDAEADGAAPRHEVQRQLDLVATVGADATPRPLAVAVPATARARAAAELGAVGVDPGDRSWIVVHPGATAPSRRYPADGFAIAADSLAHAGARIVFTGGPDEVALVDSIRERMRSPAATLAGRLSIETLAGVLQHAPLAITNNTGPAHLAAAIGTPVVDLYALTNLQHMPWMTVSRVLFHDVPCKGCLSSVCPMGHHACLALVPPSAIVDAALELLGRSPSRAPDPPGVRRPFPVVARGVSASTASARRGGAGSGGR